MPHSPEAQELLKPPTEMDELFTSGLQDHLPRTSESDDIKLSLETLPEFDPYAEHAPGGYSKLLRKQSTTASTTTTINDLQQNLAATIKKATNLTYSNDHSFLRRFNICIFLPALVTAVLCAGTASALLAWLISRRVVSTDDISFQGALVAFEGRLNDVSWRGILVHVLGTSQEDASSSSTSSETTMYGLAISSVAAHLISFTLPFTLSTFAYLLASMWVQAQTRGQVEDLPTPTQYGHLIGLCGSFGLMSIYDAGKYLSNGRKSRPPASVTLIAAFFAAVVALMITYLSSLADLWLHTAAKTFPHEFTTPIVGTRLPMTGSIINTTACAGPQSLFQDTYCNCQNDIILALGMNETSHMYEFSEWGNPDLVNEGAAVLSNNSITSQVQIIDNLATLLPRALPNGVKNVVFSTFAMNATCAPATCQQSPAGTGTSIEILFRPISCPEFKPPFVVNQTEGVQAMSTLNQFDASTNALVFDSSGPLVENSIGYTPGYTLNSTLNPAGVLVELAYDGVNPPVAAPVDQPGWYTSGVRDTAYHMFYISRCVLDVWNVTISYTAPADGSTAPSFTIASDYPVARTNFNTTSALLGALDAAYSVVLASRLSTSLQGSLNVSSDDFSQILAGNLSQGILALAAPLTERTRSVQGEAVTSATVSRYPLAPLCVVLALIYGYSALALGVGVAACLLPSRVISDREMDGGGEGKSTRELDLVHSRLTKPRMCIADRFDDDSAVEEVQRLGVGLTNSGRDTDGCNDKIFRRNSRRFKVDTVGNLEDI
ncbi:hypothetical protein FB45DRAFT_1051139 [Roridomyces roridus]|uniref:Uncharacterized protein n=1 Tax=Roridomyces roridus TaxID=1738132 RepID=A0AAD7CNM5_9AGAR|nr:hypothetical protein FB45DRAFT_1051139 [Roridomyces roridus]